MNSLLQCIKDTFFPPRCPICNRVIAACERPLCAKCAADLPLITGEICADCGRETRYCSCHFGTFMTDGIAAPFYYVDGVRRSVEIFKHSEDTDRTAYYIAKMAESIYRQFGDSVVDYITCVPMHPQQKQQRGFDQVRPLALGLSKTLHVPFADMLRKVMKTSSQKTLSMEERRCNLLGAFDYVGSLPLEGKTVLLVDDVVTTGSTTNECAKMLKIYGARRVYVAAVALTKLEKKDKQER